ncbi:MAG: NUDIX domain-containing protein [bacterium]
MSKMIPHKKYKEIVDLMPILTVDIIVKSGEHFVLVKRNREPMKNAFWTPGGRVFKGETIHKSAKRILKGELGVRIDKFTFIGVYEDRFTKSHFGCPTHTTSVVFEAQLEKTNIKLDHQSSSWILSDKLPNRFLKKLLRH